MQNKKTNHLEKLFKSMNTYNKETNILQEQLMEFESEHDLPIGISINEINWQKSLIDTGILEVRLISSYKKEWDTKYHQLFCKDLSVKLVKIYDEKVYFYEGERRIFTYHYTFENNPQFKPINPSITGGRGE